MIAIKGMKMPDGCSDCPCYHRTESDFEYCWITSNDLAYWEEVLRKTTRPDWCPLVEVKDEEDDETD